MSVLQLSTTAQELESVIENITDAYGITEDHNIYDISVEKGHKYSFEVQSTTIYRDELGIDRYNQVDIRLKNTNNIILNEHSGLTIDKTIAGSTLITFVAQETATYTLDVFGSAGFTDTTEYGESTRIESPFKLISQDMGKVDNYADSKLEASNIDISGFSADGFQTATVADTSIYDSVNDSDWFKFDAKVGVDYKITVNTDDGVYKRIKLESPTEFDWFIGDKSVVAGKDTDTSEQYYYLATEDKTMYFEVTGGTGDYEVLIEEADIDPEGNTAADALNVTLGETYTTSLYENYDYDFFKISTVSGEMYKVTILTDQLNSKYKNDDYGMSGYTDTTGDLAEGDYLFAWGDNLGDGHKIDGGTEFYFQADDTDYYAKILTYSYANVKGDYSIKFEHSVDETVDSIDDMIDSAQTRIVLTDTQASIDAGLTLNDTMSITINGTVFTHTVSDIKQSIELAHISLANTINENSNFTATFNTALDKLIVSSVAGDAIVVSDYVVADVETDSATGKSATIYTDGTNGSVVTTGDFENSTITVDFTDAQNSGLIYGDTISIDMTGYSNSTPTYTVTDKTMTLDEAVAALASKTNYLEYENGMLKYSFYNYYNPSLSNFTVTNYTPATPDRTSSVVISETFATTDVNEKTLLVDQPIQTVTAYGDNDLYKVSLDTAGLYIFEADSYVRLNIFNKENITVSTIDYNSGHFDANYDYVYDYDTVTYSAGELSTTSYGYNSTNEVETDGNLTANYMNSGTWTTDGVSKMLTFEITDGTNGTLDTRGDYYLSATMLENDMWMGITNTQLGLTYQALDDVDDGGNTKAESTTIDIGTQYTAQLHTLEDEDWFKVDLNADETYKFVFDSDQVAHIDLTLESATTGEVLFTNNQVSEGLTAVFTKVYEAAGNNMQKAMDFLAHYNLADYKALMELYKTDYSNTTAAQREDFLLYTKLLSEMKIQFNNNDLQVVMKDENNVEVNDGNITIADLNKKLTFSGDANDMRLNDSAFTSSFETYMTDLILFAKDLQDTTILDNGITEAEILSNQKVISTEIITKVSDTDFTALTSKKNTLETSIDTAKLETGFADTIEQLTTLKTADYTNASFEDIIAVNKIINELTSSLDSEDPLGYMDKIVIYNSYSPVIDYQNGIDTFTITDSVGTSVSVTPNTSGHYYTSSLGDLSSLEDGYWTVKLTYTDTTKGIYEKEIVSTGTLGSDARIGTDINAKIESEITSIVNSIDSSSSSLEIADAIGDLLNIKEQLDTLNTIKYTKDEGTSWEYISTSLADLVFTTAQQTSFETLQTQLVNKTFTTFEAELTSDLSGYSATDFNTIVDEIQELDSAYSMLEGSSFTTEEKNLLNVLIEDRKVQLINLMDATTLTDALNSYSAIINALDITNPILTETQADTLSGLKNTAQTNVDSHANMPVTNYDPLTLTLSETITELTTIANNTSTLYDKIESKDTVEGDWSGLVAYSEKIVFNGTSIDINDWMGMDAPTSITISDGTNPNVVLTTISGDMMSGYTATADLSSLATDTELTVTTIDGSITQTSSLYVLSTAKQSELDTAKTDAIAAVTISDADITTEVNSLSSADYSSATASELISAWAKLNSLSNFLWQTTLSQEDQTTLNTTISDTKIILQESFTYDMINSLITSYETIASDTNSTAETLSSTLNDISVLGEIIWALDPENTANDYGVVETLHNVTGETINLNGSQYEDYYFKNSDYQNAQANFETLVNILIKVDPDALIEYKDTYISDLFNINGIITTADDFQTLIELEHGGTWYAAGDKGESYAIAQDDTYYVKFDKEYIFSASVGEYDFEIMSVNSEDAGDTIETSVDFKTLDYEDYTYKDTSGNLEGSSDTLLHREDAKITGIITTQADTDMYRYDFVKNQQYNIFLDNSSLGIKIFDSNGARVTDYSSYSNTLIAQEDATYYIEVEQRSEYITKNDYILTVEDLNKKDAVGASIATSGDFLDISTSDEQSVKDDAFKLDFAGDKDWFKIETEFGSHYTIDVDSDTMKYMDVKVFDEFGVEVWDNALIKSISHEHIDDLDDDIAYITQNWDSVNDMSINLYAALGSQDHSLADAPIADGKTHYIQIENYSETGSYNLTVTLDDTADDYGSNANTAGAFNDIDASDSVANDGIISGSFEKRNDRDWFSYDWEKAVYEVVIDSATVDKINLDFNFVTNTGTIYNTTNSLYYITKNFVANRADTDGSSMNYIITSKYDFNHLNFLSIQNTFGAGDYTLKINKIADLDTAPIDITLTDGLYENTQDAIIYQTDTSNYNLEAVEGKTYQIELSAADAEAVKLGQLLIEIKDENENIVDILKEWNPTDVMTRASFEATNSEKYSIEIKTANSQNTNTLNENFTFKLQEVDMSGDIGSSISNHGDFTTLDSDNNGIIEGVLNTTIDKDWYKYNFEEGKQYLISVDVANSEIGLVHIYDSEGNLYKANQMWDSNDNLSTSDRTILFNPTKTGEFYLEVADAVAQTFTLKVEEYTDSADISEDTTTTAVLDQSTNPSAIFTSLIDNKDDKDWIEVSLTAGEVYKIETTPSGDKMPIPLDLVINGIFDSTGTLLEGSSSVNGTQYIKPENTGTYYIEVAGKNDTLGYYDIQVTKDTTTDSVKADSTTTEVITVGKQYTSKIDYFFDKDWIKVSLEAGKTYDISMKGNSLRDTHITGIYKADGTTIVAQSSNNDASRFTLDSKVTITADETADYFIEAAAYNDLKGTYTIDVNETEVTESLANETSSTDDANNTTATALDGITGRYTYGEISYGTDSDLFAYEFEAGVTYEINMYGADSNLGSLSNSWIKSIKDSNGQEIAGYSNAHGGKGNDSLLSFKAETTGTYYVEAASQYYSQGSFKLKVEEEGGLGVVAPIGDGSHTIMVYLGGDNNLEQSMIIDLVEMQLGTLPENWNVTFLIDRAEGYDTSFGDWTDTRQGIVTFASSSDVTDDEAKTEILSGMESLGELNTGDGETLTNFINWSAQMAQADSYSLILSNHGGGITGSVWDDASGHDNIIIPELTEAIEASTVHQNALSSNDKGFEMIGFDTCLQGVLDQQYALKDVTDVVLASEEVSWTDYWDYEEWFDDISTIYNQDLDNNGEADGVVTGAAMATAFVEQIDRNKIEGNSRDTTYSAVETEYLDEVVDAVAVLNNEFKTISAIDKEKIEDGSKSVVIFSHETQMDLGAFANMVDNLDIGGAGSAVDKAAYDVKIAVSNAVISNTTNMTGNGGEATGIAINYNGGIESDDYMNNFELADMMNMHEFFEVV